MQEKPIHNKYNGNKNTKNKNFNRHRSTHKNYKNTKNSFLFYRTREKAQGTFDLYP